MGLDDNPEDGGSAPTWLRWLAALGLAVVFAALFALAWWLF
jgi:hypothetical protein